MKRLFVCLILYCSTMPFAWASDKLVPEDFMLQVCQKVIEDESVAASFVAEVVNADGLMTAATLKSQETALYAAFSERIKDFGPIIECVPGNKRTVGDHVLMISSVGLHNSSPSVFEGYFMKHKKGWKVFSISFSTGKDNFPWQ